MTFGSIYLHFEIHRCYITPWSLFFFGEELWQRLNIIRPQKRRALNSPRTTIERLFFFGIQNRRDYAYIIVLRNFGWDTFTEWNGCFFGCFFFPQLCRIFFTYIFLIPCLQDFCFCFYSVTLSFHWFFFHIIASHSWKKKKIRQTKQNKIKIKIKIMSHDAASFSLQAATMTDIYKYNTTIVMLPVAVKEIYTCCINSVFLSSSYSQSDIYIRTMK